MTFPSNPTNGQKYHDLTHNYLYVYDSLNQEWRNLSTRGELNMDGYVPAMTSNSYDGFTASGSSRFNTSTYDYYKAFDQNNSTEWASAGQTTNAWIQITLPEREVVWRIGLSSRLNFPNEYFYNWACQYYDYTISQWVDWDHQRFDLNGIFYFNKPTQTAPSDLWRIYCNTGTGPNTGMSFCQFYVKT